MELRTPLSNSELLHPVLFMPRTCTPLEINCEASSICVDLTIITPDIKGDNAVIYSGACNVKLIDNCDFEEHVNSACIDGNNNEQFAIVDQSCAIPTSNQSKVWIDPSRSPYVYNTGVIDPQVYPVYVPQANHITVEQHSTYITQNVYNYNDVQYSPLSELEHRILRKNNNELSNQNSPDELIYYEEGEECGVLLPQLQEVRQEKETGAGEEKKNIGLQSENHALKQLMSSDVQMMSKQQKTILYLGNNSQSGETIQKIAINDPYMECGSVGNGCSSKCLVKTVSRTKRMQKQAQKKYQCDKCKQIFDQIADFKQHMVVSHKLRQRPLVTGGEVKFKCLECGKNLKNQEKFEMHCLGHGNPELECDTCHKVFASKFTLRNHKKIHARKHQCHFCTKTYSKSGDLKAHVARYHCVFYCDLCNYSTSVYDQLEEHKSTHTVFSKDFNELEDDIVSINLEADELGMESLEQVVVDDEDARAEAAIAQVFSDDMFLTKSKRMKRGNKCKNACTVCKKSFDRIGDLKRHLIEHMIRSTLAKNPVNKDGILNIVCEVCQAQTFSKVDKYKAHLREHAKLTLYKCTFCDKSFSDSSNFSKHKKIHGSLYFQCDLCQRKFNSKKMITQHMKYHKENLPIPCLYCDKVFHFKSMLNKHIKSSHVKEIRSKFRCGFCHKYFSSLRDKWDHEWEVHSVRKTIADCEVCGAKYRKYSELKRHCTTYHNLDIPSAKHYTKKRKRDI